MSTKPAEVAVAPPKSKKMLLIVVAVMSALGATMSLPGLAGMTLLASGAVALIYNPVALATLYGESARAATQAAMAGAGLMSYPLVMALLLVVGGAVVDRGGGVEPDPGVAVFVVVVGEERLAELAGVLDRAE